MKQKSEIKISVRNLVEFILRSGDIDNRGGTGFDKEAMQAGSRIHRKIQQSRKIQQGKKGNYQAEVSLKKSFDFENYQLTVEGRADGIFTEEGKIIVEEIKGMYLDPDLLKEPFQVHQAQAKCYAYFYGKEKGLEEIVIQMTYVNLEQENVKQFQEEFSILNLEEWFLEILKEYRKWTDYEYEQKEKRHTAIKKIEFPFPYREGQRELTISAYRTIQRKKILFIQAATGIGKTISTIFPAVKAVGEGLGDKIFYLTAKTIARTAAEEAFSILREHGLYFKTVTITAKDKLCFQEERECNPIACPYARGHYDRINAAVYEILEKEVDIKRDTIKKYAEKHKVCPFEMCLDISTWTDGIICDYNYVFDPNVKLKRYFAEGIKGDYIFLVDEAHNLVDRARGMYSASLYKEEFLEIKKLIKPYSKRLTQSLERCNKNLLEWKKQCQTYFLLENIEGFILNLLKVAVDMEEFMKEEHLIAERKKISEFYLKIRHFLNIYGIVDESYQIYVENTEQKKFCICLFCVHTANQVGQCLEKANSSILFSATLLPIQYYKELLSKNLESEDYAIYIPSPFAPENRLLLLGTDVTSKYTRRNESEYQKIYQHIENAVSKHSGNYMVFFPSYHLLQKIYDIYQKSQEKKIEVVCQQINMREEEKEAFLERFEQKKQMLSMAAFCVLGGIFSEGIDLVGDKLIGVVIVGTGLPQIGTEREILKNYFELQKKNGFDYAYRFPGMNKVLQAAGRVIRSQKDRGIILLLDSRFEESAYQKLFPKEWADYKKVNITSEEKWIQEFWNIKGKEKASE